LSKATKGKSRSYLGKLVPIFLSISLGALASCRTSSSRGKGDTIEADDEKHFLGQGYEGVSNAFYPSDCIQAVNVERQLMSRVTLGYKRDMTMEELADVVGGGFGARLKVFEAGMEFAKQNAADQLSSNFTLHIQALVGADILKTENEVSPWAAQLYPDGMAFRRACGDHFVQSIFYGATLTAQFKLKFQNKEDRKNFGANFGFSLNDEASAVSLKAKAGASEGSLKNIRNASISVTVLQLGGDPGQVANALGSGTSTEFHCATDFQKCIEKISRVLDYAQNNFSRQVGVLNFPGYTSLYEMESQQTTAGSLNSVRNNFDPIASGVGFGDTWIPEAEGQRSLRNAGTPCNQLTDPGCSGPGHTPAPMPSPTTTTIPTVTPSTLPPPISPLASYGRGYGTMLNGMCSQTGVGGVGPTPFPGVSPVSSFGMGYGGGFGCQFQERNPAEFNPDQNHFRKLIPVKYIVVPYTGKFNKYLDPSPHEPGAVSGLLTNTWQMADLFDEMADKLAHEEKNVQDLSAVKNVHADVQKLADELKDKAETNVTRMKKVIGDCRARYWHCENIWKDYLANGYKPYHDFMVKNLKEFADAEQARINQQPVIPFPGAKGDYPWAKGEPNNSRDVLDWLREEDCAVANLETNGQDARWNDERCAQDLPFACKDSAGKWFIDKHSGRWEAFNYACGANDFGKPKDAADNKALAKVMRQAGATKVWVNFQDIDYEGLWTDEPPVR
jgi:hypothetical protein